MPWAMPLSRLLLLLGGLCALSTPAQARRLWLAGSAEAGPELDTNANRVLPIEVPCPGDATCVAGQCMRLNCDGGDSCFTGDTCLVDPEQPVRSWLMRLTASADLRVRLGRHLLAASYGGGVKLFGADGARDADELVQRGALRWSMLLPAKAVLSLEGLYYDAFQRQSQRDFRTGSGMAHLTLGRSLRVSGAAGYRALSFKPNESYDFHGPLARLELGSQLSSGPADEPVDWSLSLAYTAALRSFQGQAEASPAPCAGRPDDICSRISGAAREDLNHVLRAEVGYLGNAEAGAWYSLELNRSNSHGETFSRHVVGLRFTAPLIWGTFLTAKVVLQLSRFRDAYLISRIPNETFVSIEDENRSRLLLQLARDIGWGLAVNLRYGLYVNESVTQSESSLRIPDFLRQTLFVGLRWEVGG